MYQLNELQRRSDLTMHTVQDIEQQYRQGSRTSEWKQYLDSVKITDLHGWNGQEISFCFPLTAIVGENGTGKSTVLKAAACAYRNKSGATFYPSQMFVRTLWDERAHNNALIEYVIEQGGERRVLKWQRKKEWGLTPKGRNGSGKPERSVFFLDISRTLPLDATAGYAKIAKQATEEMDAGVILSEELVRDLSYVLGRDYTAARFVGTDIYSDRRIGLITKNTDKTGTEISQFHQGAGEHSLLNLFRLLTDIPSQSLLLIDEIENSLHPQAQRRLILHLLRLCLKKKLQIILTTHSPYVLEELPPVARIMLMRLSTGIDVLYEISPSFALSALDEEQHPEMLVYVEDREAEAMFWEVLKLDPSVYEYLHRRIKTIAVGASSVVRTLDRVGREHRMGYKAMGIVDGDQRENAPECLSLPGSKAPEREVLEALQENNWNNLKDRFGLGAGNLYKYLDDALRDRDHHWLAYIGDKIDKSKDAVWDTLLDEWRKTCLNKEEAATFAEAVRKRLDD